MHLLVIFPVQAEAQSPLIVLTHGLLLTGEDYRSYALHMATHGLVVALPTLPMSLFSMHHGELARDVAFVVEACLKASVGPPAIPLKAVSMRSESVLPDTRWAASSA